MSAKKKGVVDWSLTLGEPSSQSCVLLLHGLNSSRETIVETAKAILAERPSSYILVPKLPLAWHSCIDYAALAEEVLDHLTQLLGCQTFQRVFLVGHSAGGVLAQAVYLRSWSRETPLRNARMILVAPISRGWEISHHLPLSAKIAWMAGLWMLPLLRFWEGLKSTLARRKAHPPWISQLRKSSPYLVWLRLAWLKLHKDHPEARPEVVQLLGSIDELVSWRDMVDAATGQDFLYLEVPFSDHVSILDFADPKFGEARRKILIEAFDEFEAVRRSDSAVEPWDTDPIPPDPRVKRVVFVIHGIRDEGHWTQKIAARAKHEFALQEGCTRDQIEVVTSSYGYFSMMQFLLYPERRAKVSWLVEHYVEAKRRFPNADFSYIGHSNGTYLAAHALEKYPDIEFERLVFTGSVVSSKFDWEQIGRRVRYVLNYAASADWVVGIFPRIADLLPLRLVLGPSLGGAGVEGFPDSRQVQTLRYRKGQHGAAIEEANWPHLARFAVVQAADLKFPLERPGDPDSYLKERAVLFRPLWGAVTSIGGWLLALGILGALLPWLAWNHPASFWVVPLLVVAAAMGANVVAEAAGNTLPLRSRHRLRKRLVSATVVAAVGLLAWLLRDTPFRTLLEAGNQPREFVRTLSVVLYLFLVHRALTRV